MKSKIALVLTCYNEQEVLENTINTLLKLLDDNNEIITNDSSLYLIDNGSTDKTLEIIKDFATQYANINYLVLPVNVGQQNGLIAGIENSYKHFDALITLDADLQDDIALIPQMIREFQNGEKIVFSARSDRLTDSFIKRKTSDLYYSLMSFLGSPSIKQSADFRLLSFDACEKLLSLKENHLFLRNHLMFFNLKHKVLYFSRKAREQGETKYNFYKLISFAIDGIVSYTNKPLRLVAFLAFFSLCIAAGLFVFIIFTFFTNRVVGWASTTFIITFFASINLLAVAIIAEYLAEIYREIKNRPRYVAQENSLEK